ncbi:hypothetical protein TNCV_809111 [Trichonephila clavipes]|nr:hypothetical protein TNCV_809111 [Trichonephila clavipes]
MMMIPAYNKKRCAAFLSRRKSIIGERPTIFQKKIQPCLTRDSNPNPLGFSNAGWRGRALDGKDDGGSNFRNETGVSPLWAVVEEGSRSEQRKDLQMKKVCATIESCLMKTHQATSRSCSSTPSTVQPDLAPADFFFPHGSGHPGKEYGMGR